MGVHQRDARDGSFDRQYGGELVAAGGARLPSVVVFRLRDVQLGNVNHYLHQIADQYQDALTLGYLLECDKGKFASVSFQPLHGKHISDPSAFILT